MHGSLAAIPCMSRRSSHVTVRFGSDSVEVSIAAEGRTSGSPRGNNDEEQGWELVSEGRESELELVVSTDPPPLHLLRRSQLRQVQGWTPEDRIRRAYRFGQQDTQAALDSGIQPPKDDFPVRSSVFVVLYEPSGNWPRYTRSLDRFYEAVKIPLRGTAPNRRSNWRPGVVSRGFPSIVEAEAYLAGGRCHLPREEF